MLILGPSPPVNTLNFSPTMFWVVFVFICFGVMRSPNTWILELSLPGATVLWKGRRHEAVAWIRFYTILFDCLGKISRGGATNPTSPKTDYCGGASARKSKCGHVSLLYTSPAFRSAWIHKRWRTFFMLSSHADSDQRLLIAEFGGQWPFHCPITRPTHIWAPCGKRAAASFWSISQNCGPFL